MATIPAGHSYPYLDELISGGGSDVHLVSGKPVMIRANGEMRRAESITPPSRAELLLLIAFATGVPGEAPDFSRPDYAFSYRDKVFRISYFTSDCKEHVCAVIRHLPQNKRTLEELGLPRVFRDKILRKQHGLVLVAGATGSGKTTTLASAIDHINNTQEGNIITLEDPVEIWHAEKKCRIVQLQLGEDFSDFPSAIKHSLRRDPDVILVGELRDHESIAAALTAAETGHLVFGTLHTASAKDTISRILDAAPDSDKNQQRAMLSKSLLCVVAQKLVPTIRGGRVAAFEVMVRTDAIGTLIRNGNFDQIYNEINVGSQFDMVTLDRSLEMLAQRRIITREIALEFSNYPDVLTKKFPISA